MEYQKLATDFNTWEFSVWDSIQSLNTLSFVGIWFELLLALNFIAKIKNNGKMSYLWNNIGDYCTGLLDKVDKTQGCCHLDCSRLDYSRLDYYIYLKLKRIFRIILNTHEEWLLTSKLEELRYDGRLLKDHSYIPIGWRNTEDSSSRKLL